MEELKKPQITIDVKLSSFSVFENKLVDREGFKTTVEFNAPESLKNEQATHHVTLMYISGQDGSAPEFSVDSDYKLTKADAGITD